MKFEFYRHASQDEPRLLAALSLYAASFPEHEQRLFCDLAAALSDPAFFSESIWQGETLLGLLFYWKYGAGNCYVEHFAVNPALRGRSIGSGILSSFCAQHPLSVLEIDPLADEVSVRRKGFYERLGFCLNPYEHRHPPYRVGNAPHPLLVMSWPRVLEQTEYSEFTEFLSHRVMRYSLGNTGKTAEK